MTARRVLITGSSGLIGSEAVTYYDGIGCEVYVADNNMRREIFGPKEDTLWNLCRLQRSTRRFTLDGPVRITRSLRAIVEERLAAELSAGQR